MPKSPFKILSKLIYCSCRPSLRIIHFPLDIPPPILGPSAREKIGNFPLGYSSLKYGRSCMDTSLSYANMGTATLYCMIQINEICIFSDLIKSCYLCEIRNKAMTESALCSLVATASIIILAFLFLIGRRNHLLSISPLLLLLFLDQFSTVGYHTFLIGEAL